MSDFRRMPLARRARRAPGLGVHPGAERLLGGAERVSLRTERVLRDQHVPGVQIPKTIPSACTRRTSAATSACRASARRA
ncbi:hypothetical protein SMD44_08264 [Streptomyces alboflavus]|uniref:Uncharacterized protein n=1 Tax=Streptomyces alboflavus TaxID=67267 RepID=A0A1Z1WQU3_9ACTN|nr:hypothetical protein SMD44_08264 [Streptomyces alboflavus]